MRTEFKKYLSCPEWWDSEAVKHNGFIFTSSLWSKFLNSAGIGSNIYIEILVNKKRAALVSVQDMLIGGNILLRLPNIFLNLLRKLNFMHSYSLHLQPLIIDQKIKVSEQKKLSLAINTVRYLISMSKENNRMIIPADLICFKSIETARKLKDYFPEYLSLIATSRLNLKGKSEHELLYKTFAEPVKRQIKKANKLGIVVKRVDFQEFYKYLSESFKSNKLSVNSIKYYSILSSILSQSLNYYCAYYENKVIAGSGVIYYAKNIIEFSMFVTPYCRENKMPGGDLIKWHIITQGLKDNMEYLEFNMISVPENIEDNEKLKNINFFKLKWGGDILYGVKIEKFNSIMYIIQKLKHILIGK